MEFFRATRRTLAVLIVTLSGCGSEQSANVAKTAEQLQQSLNQCTVERSIPRHFEMRGGHIAYESPQSEVDIIIEHLDTGSQQLVPFSGKTTRKLHLTDSHAILRQGDFGAQDLFWLNFGVDGIAGTADGGEATHLIATEGSILAGRPDQFGANFVMAWEPDPYTGGNGDLVFCSGISCRDPNQHVRVFGAGVWGLQDAAAGPGGLSGALYREYAYIPELRGYGTQLVLTNGVQRLNIPTGFGTLEEPRFAFPYIFVASYDRGIVAYHVATQQWFPMDPDHISPHAPPNLVDITRTNDGNFRVLLQRSVTMVLAEFDGISWSEIAAVPTGALGLLRGGSVDGDRVALNAHTGTFLIHCP